MIVDASAVLAILLREEDAASFARAIEAADVLRMSVVNYVEGAVRIDSFEDDEAVAISTTSCAGRLSNSMP